MSFGAAGEPPRRAAPQSAMGVGELVARLQVGLQEAFPRAFWVEAEVGGFKVARSGHAFFALKEANAQIEAVLWRDRLARLPFTPEEGSRVIALVRKVDFYAPSGRLRAHVDDIKPQGVGALAKALEERKARLAAEGVFDDTRKQPIPFLPARVGIVTAARSAALRDMLKTLEDRFAERRILLRPCRVQGKGAAQDIAAALDDLNRDGSSEVILLARGGGSLEDLWCFNEEAVVRAISRSGIPIVAGIGHEIDWTLADLVADLRVATPTAAAQRCVPVRAELESYLESLDSRLRTGMSRHLDLARMQLRAHGGALSNPRAVVTQRSLRLEALTTRAREALLRLTPMRRHRLDRAAGVLRARLPNLPPRRAALVHAGRTLETAMMAGIERCRAALVARTAQVDALSPLAVLDRGFAVVRNASGGLVRDASTLGRGDELGLRFARGAARVQVLGSEEEVEQTSPSGLVEEEPKEN